MKSLKNSNSKKWRPAFFISITTFLAFPAFNTHTPPFKDLSGNTIENSISVMEKIPLGGSKQWVFIRGKDASKPLLLFLHGGPGSTSTAHIRKFLPELEEKFVVIHWDQRGAGKSFSAGRPKRDFNIDQIIKDVGELSDKMLKRFNREKMYLMAASWGTYLGIEAVRKWPDYYYAYIGSGQVVHQEVGEQISYDYVLSKAQSQPNTEALQILEKIGRPPYPPGKHVKYLSKQRKLLLQYGGSFRNKEIQNQFLDGSIIWRQAEYNLIDKINWIRGQYKSEKILGPTFRKINFMKAAKKLELPIYFIQGKYDQQTPTILVEEYFKTLNAPYKKLYLFEQSAHIPIVEEKERFLKLLDEILY